MVKDEKTPIYGPCWACGQLGFQRRRIEHHHIYGKQISADIIPLCVMCHDLVDRTSLEQINVAEEFLEAEQELDSIGRIKTQKIRLLLLRTIKILAAAKEK